MREVETRAIGGNIRIRTVACGAKERDGWFGGWAGAREGRYRRCALLLICVRNGRETARARTGGGSDA